MGLTATVEAFLDGAWVDISGDVFDDAISIRYGINGQGPLDCVAGSGECRFSLWNEDALGNEGFYSPLHANVRPGWTLGVPLRATFSDGSNTAVKHRGKVRVIDPEAGLARTRRVDVVSLDGMNDLADADVRSIDIQVNQSEETLIDETLDAVAAESQPVARDLDVGVDTFPYAFDNLGRGTKALGLIHDVAVSSFALVAMRGDGTLFSKSRHTRASGSSAFTFTDENIVGLFVPAEVEKLYNVVRVTIHPRTIDAAATTVLWAATGTPLSIAAGATIELWVTYRNPSESKTLIGGLDVVNPPASGTDYAANSAANGSGANLTASLAVTLEPFASTAKWTITNNAGVTAFLVDGSGNPKLQVRGKGVYDIGPQTYEAQSTQPYGSKPLNIDLKYQGDPFIAQSYATYIKTQREALTAQLDRLEFLANAADDVLAQAILREPGDLVTVDESLTGLDNVPAVIHEIELNVQSGNLLQVRYGLAPAAPFRSWVLGVTGSSELGVATVLGF